MTNYLTDNSADIEDIRAQHQMLLAEENANNLDRTGPTAKFTLKQVRWAQDRIESTGLLEKIATWREEDRENERLHGKHAGGRPRTVALTDEHIVIGLMLLAKEHSPLWNRRLFELFWYRLTPKARTHLGLDHMSVEGTEHQQWKTWSARTHRALASLITLMDPYPFEKIVTNRAERDHFKSLRELNYERWNLEAKAGRKNEFTFAMIEMSMKHMGPDLLSAWEGSVSIDQTTVRAASRRGFKKGESADPSIDSTVLEMDAGWAIKDPEKRSDTSNHHAGEGVWGFKANFATMCAEDPWAPTPHPRLIAAMTISTPNVGVSTEAIELLTQLSVNGYPAGRVTTDKEYAANMKPEDYHFPLLALGYRVVTDYRKDRRGVRGNQRGALILDGKHKCPGLPTKYLTLNQRYASKVESDETRAKTSGRRPTREQREQARLRQERHFAEVEESALYNFKVHEGPDEFGAVKLSCPARGKSATVECDLYTPKVKQTNRDRAIVPNPPVDNPPECCTHEVLTMPPIREWRDLQSLDWQGREWHQTYKRDRNIVEGSNSHVKEEGSEALGSSGRRRLRGLTAQQFLVTFLVVNANLRKVYKFRKDLELTEAQKPQRKPRQRDHLNIRNYDPRVAEVRAAMGLPPLENSRRKDATRSGIGIAR